MVSTSKALALLLTVVLLGTALPLAITYGPAAALDTGFASPSANASNFLNSEGAYADDTDVAQGVPTSREVYSGYGLTIPADATITGIQVRLDWYLDSDNGTSSIDVELSSDFGGMWTGIQSDYGEPTSTDYSIVLPTSPDTWERGWTPADFSGDNFQVRVTCNSDNSSRVFYVDWVAVKVFYAPVDRLVVTGTTGMSAGGSNLLTITARDSNGEQALNYDGTKTLTFSGPGTAPDEQVPTVAGEFIEETVDVTFVDGVGTANLVAYSAETTTVDVTDGTVDSYGDPTYDLDLTVGPAAAFRLEVAGTAVMAAGDTNELTITAKDPYGNTATSYAGPKTLTFYGPVAAPGGQTPTVESVNIGLSTLVNFSSGVSVAGAATLVAYRAETTTVDVTDGSISSFANPLYDLDLTVNPADADQLILSPDSATAGSGMPFTVTVTAEDPYSNTTTGYTGTVGFTSTDSGATLPPAYVFSAGDSGIHTFTDGVTLVTSGAQSVTVTDMANSSVTGSALLNVIASNAHHIVISPDTAAITAGGIQAYTAEAFDQFDNSLGDFTVDTGFIIQTGAGGSWTNNVYSSQYVGTWTVTGSYLGLTDTASVTVTAGPAGQIVIAPASGTTTAGDAFNITVSARDTYGNPAITYSGTIAFTSSDTAAGLPADYAFQPPDAGVHVFSVTLSTAGSQSITVTDTANAALTDSKTWFVESSPAPANRPPAQPGNSSPANGAAAFPVTPALQSSAFSDPDSSDTHAASQWQITTAPGNYSSPIFDSGTRTAELTAIAVPSGVLTYSGTYYWHVRHQDNRGAWSAWSAETSFATAALPLADFAIGSVSGSGGAVSIIFANLSSGGVAPLTYAWDFDNDGSVDSTEAEPSHAYANPGTYTVSLAIQDAVGNSNTRVKTSYLTVLSSAGATAVTADGQVSAGFPEGAFSGTPVVTIDNTGTCVLSDIPEGYAKGDTCFIIKVLDETGAEVATLSRPITITVKYAAEDLAAADGDAGKLVLGYWDKAARRWTVLETTANVGQTTLSVSTSHLSLWAVLVATSGSGGGGGTPIWIWLVAGLVILVAAGLIAWKSVSIRVVRDDPWRR